MARRGQGSGRWGSEDSGGWRGLSHGDRGDLLSGAEGDGEGQPGLPRPAGALPRPVT